MHLETLNNFCHILTLFDSFVNFFSTSWHFSPTFHQFLSTFSTFHNFANCHHKCGEKYHIWGRHIFEHISGISLVFAFRQIHQFFHMRNCYCDNIIISTSLHSRPEWRNKLYPYGCQILNVCNGQFQFTNWSYLLIGLVLQIFKFILSYLVLFTHIWTYLTINFNQSYLFRHIFWLLQFRLTNVHKDGLKGYNLRISFFLNFCLGIVTQ